MGCHFSQHQRKRCLPRTSRPLTFHPGPMCRPQRAPQQRGPVLSAPVDSCTVGISQRQWEERARDEITRFARAHGDVPTARTLEAPSDYQQQEGQNLCNVVHTYTYANCGVGFKSGNVVACLRGPPPMTMNDSFNLRRGGDSGGRVKRAFRIKSHDAGEAPAWNGAATEPFEAKSLPVPRRQNSSGSRAPFSLIRGYPRLSPGEQGAEQQQPPAKRWCPSPGDRGK